jgi:hypothetical protein
LTSFADGSKPSNTAERCVRAARAVRTAAAVAFVALITLSLTCSRGYGSVGVVLNESLNESMDRISGTGHTAVYFSNICAESPVKLRLCRPGELGSVISTYINIGEDQAFEWNVAPLNIYLYGVEDARNRPIFGSYKVKHELEERYREKYLTGLCDSAACHTSYKSEWREMVAATLIRGVYIFELDTTEVQDRAIIAKFNDAPNKSNFNGITRNCADFTRGIVNTYFPRAVSTDYINDFGMTSPKAVARTFTKYAQRHPESNFRVLHFAQVPGTIKRSSEVRAGTEQLYRSKKLLLPMAVFLPHELPFVAGSYWLTGRFSPQRTFEKHPATGADALIAVVSPEREKLLGTSEEWKDYRRKMETMVKDNKENFEQDELAHFFKHLDKAGKVDLDNEGSAWMQVTENGEPLRVGVSASNALAPDSNTSLAFKLLLARAGVVLKSAKHRRETMADFRQDWTRLQGAANSLSTTSAEKAAAAVKNTNAMISRSGSTE